MRKKLFNFVVNSIEKILKLLNHEKYSEWKRTMKNCLKIIKLWKWITVNTIVFITFIISTVDVTFVEIFVDIYFENIIIIYANNVFLFLFTHTKALKQFNEKHNLICIVLRINCEKNVYLEIENIKNVANVWNYLKQMFKFKEFNFFNNTFRQFDNFILIIYNSFANYVLKFRNMLNKFKTFFFKFVLFEDYLIYRFHVNLNLKHDNYFEQNAQIHDVFNENDFSLHILSKTMQHIQNTIINSKIAVAEKIVIFMIAMHKFIHRNRKHENAKKVESVNRNVNNNKRNEIVVHFNSNKTVVITKIIKYCNHCKKSYHIDDECRKLHFELTIQNNQRNKI